ncbi:hypothetical protein KP509_13G048900 [Ceratopteris richardii]|uniref:Cytochrome P450 n=2 Tax=Ceratopteris richardii TaxID=49495 RepID=A0A8T2TFK8_CERRI|nr:hypothetical protein KP509_13G048900 [Ceratopteris richardii]
MAMPQESIWDVAAPGGRFWQWLPTPTTTSILWAALALGLCWLWWKNNSQNDRPRRTQGGRKSFMPGPRPLPIIGNLHQLGELPHRTLAELSKTHGPLMFLRLGSVPFVVASSSQAAKLVLQTHDKTFAGRPVHWTAPKIIMGPTMPSVLFHQPDAYWRLARQICVSDFFSNKRMHYFQGVRMREVSNLLVSILNVALEGSKPILLREVLQAGILNIIAIMSVGKPLQRFLTVGSGSCDVDIVRSIFETKASLGLFEIGDYIPWLAWLDLQGNRKRHRQVAKNARTVLQRIVDTRRIQHGSQGNPSPQDLLDILLKAAGDPNNKDIQFDDAAVRAILLDMFVAGTDTATMTIEWALAELLQNRNKLQKLITELHEVVGSSRIVHENDLPNLSYLRAVVNETLRLHPSAPLLPPHRSMDACDVDGYHIPMGTNVYVNAWTIQRDPSLWENPLDFEPERFLGSPMMDSIPGQYMELIPFGGGRRSCPGWRLGLLITQIVLANILHAFGWEIPIGTSVSLDEKFGIAVSMLKPLYISPLLKLESNILIDAQKTLSDLVEIT